MTDQQKKQLIIFLSVGNFLLKRKEFIMKLKILKRLTAIVLSVVCVVAMFSATISASATEADTRAAGTSSSSNITVTVNKGKSYKYLNGTNLTAYQYSAVNGKVYCVDPGLNSALGSSNSKSLTFQPLNNVVTNTTIRNNLYKAFYYCVDGPGFDSSIFNNNKPTTNLSGTDYYIAMSHIIYTYLMYGKNVPANDATAKNYNDGIKSYYSKAATIWAQIEKKSAPSNYSYENLSQAYIYTGSSTTQRFIYVIYKGRIIIDKACLSSANAFAIHDDNKGSFSVEGARFDLYTDSSCKTAYKYNNANAYITIQADSNNPTKGRGKLGGADGGTVVDLNLNTLAKGGLYAKETVAPKGYKLNTSVFTFKKSSTVDSGGIPTYVINNTANNNSTVYDTPQIALELTKVSADKTITDGNACYSLAGAVYQVYTDWECTKALTVSGSYVTITTDKNGYGTYNNLALVDARNLYAKEIKASPGYELDTTKYRFFNSGKTTTKKVNGSNVTYPIYTLGRSLTDFTVPETPGLDPLNILLQKYDATTGKGTDTEKLADAEFTVKYYANNYSSLSDIESIIPTRIWAFKTDSNGYVRFRNENCFIQDKSDELYYSSSGVPEIPYGFLTVQETKAPNGYQLNDEIYFTTIDKETTDENLSWRTTNVNLDKGVLQIPEQQDTGGLSIKKTSTDGILKDVWFAVYSGKSTSGTLIGNFKTDANGLITNSTLSELTAGDYLVSELGFSNDNGKTFYYPKRYGTKPADQIVTVKTGETATVTFKNVAKAGQLIIKKAADDNKTSGIYFDVTGTNGKSYRVSTLSNGQAVISNLQVYDDNDNVIKYTIHELGLPDSTSDTGYSIPEYYLTPEDQTVDLVSNVTVVSGYNRKTVNFYNQYKTLSIALMKYSDDSAKDYPDIYFSITSDEGYNEIVSVSLSDDSFLVGRFGNKSGGYTTVSNLPALTSEGKYITYTVTELGYSDGNGGYYVPDYFFDTYLTKTVTANPDAEADTDNQLTWFGDIIIAESKNKIFHAQPSFINRHISGSLTLNKTSFNDVISDFYFELKANDGSYSNIAKTDENGNIEWKYLDLYNYKTGKRLTYTVTELGILQSDGSYIIPEWYSVPNTVTADFNIDTTSNIDFSDYNNWLKYIAIMSGSEYDTVFGTVEFNNEVTTGSLEIIKESEDGDIKDYWFNVKDNQGNDYGNYCTDNSGKVQIDKLPVYTSSNVKIRYTVKELGKCINEDDIDVGVERIFEIPYRYTTPSSKTVTLVSDRTVNALTVATIKNSLKKGSVTLYKQNENGNGCSGSEWALFKADGTAVSFTQTGFGLYFASPTGKITNLATDMNGTLIIRQLDPGSYYIVETKSPNRHMPYGKKIEFTISADSETTLNREITVPNNKSVMYNTGSIGTGIFYITGSIITVISLSIILIYLKRKRGVNKMKKAKKIMSTILAVMICITAFSMFTVSASSDLDTSKKVSISVACEKKGYTFEVFKVANLSSSATAYNYETSYKPIIDGISNEIKAGDTKSLLNALDKSTLEGAVSIGTYSSNDDASKSFTELSQGIYYIKCIKYPAGTKSVQNSVAALPYYNVSDWVYSIDTIDLAQKVQDDTPKTSKEITNSTKNNPNYTDVSLNDTVNFILKNTTAGSNSINLTTYTVYDDMSAGLTLDNNSFVVYLADKEGNKIGNNLVKNKDYTVNITQQEAGKNTTFNIALNSDYLAKTDFYETNVVYTMVEYSAKLNTYAIIGELGNPNEDIELIYGNTSGIDSVPGNTVYVYTYIAGGNKIAPDDTPLAGAEFCLYNTKQDAESETNAVATGISDSNGYVEFLNSDNEVISLQSGVYFGKETKAPDGYNIYDEVIEVDLTAEYNEVFMNGTWVSSCPKDGKATFTCTDSKVIAPQTGGYRNYILISGAILIGISLCLLVFSKKKSIHPSK